MYHLVLKGTTGLSGKRVRNNYNVTPGHTWTSFLRPLCEKHLSSEFLSPVNMVTPQRPRLCSRRTYVSETKEAKQKLPVTLIVTMKSHLDVCYKSLWLHFHL